MTVEVKLLPRNWVRGRDDERQRVLAWLRVWAEASARTSDTRLAGWISKVKRSIEAGEWPEEIAGAE
jgi:hypothetical protein